jgi:hypothetical protein
MQVEDSEALFWLNGLVSLGTVAKISLEQMKTFALGLEMSRHAYL